MRYGRTQCHNGSSLVQCCICNTGKNSHQKMGERYGDGGTNREGEWQTAVWEDRTREQGQEKGINQCRELQRGGRTRLWCRINLFDIRAKAISLPDKLGKLSPYNMENTRVLKARNTSTTMWIYFGTSGLLVHTGWPINSLFFVDKTINLILNVMCMVSFDCMCDSENCGIRFLLLNLFIWYFPEPCVLL